MPLSANAANGQCCWYDFSAPAPTPRGLSWSSSSGCTVPYHTAYAKITHDSLREKLGLPNKAHRISLEKAVELFW